MAFNSLLEDIAKCEEKAEDARKVLENLREQTANLQEEFSGNEKYNLPIAENVEQAEKNVKKLENALHNLNYRSKQGDDLGTTDKESNSWRKLNYDIQQVTNQLQDARSVLEGFRTQAVETAEVAEEKTEDTTKSIRQQNEEWKRLENAIRDSRKALEEHKGHKAIEKTEMAAQKASKSMGTFQTRLKGIALSLFVFNWITKAFNAVVAGMKEGFKNLAKYSDEYNRNMSNLNNAWSELKNSFAAAFEPLANAILPILTDVVNTLIDGVNYANQMIAILSGKNSYTKAKKYFDDYRDSIEETGKALSAFDKLNVVNDSDYKSGSDMFETVEVDTSMANQFKAISDAVDKVKDSLTALKETGGQALSFIYENGLKPIGEWLAQDFAPKGLDLYAEAFEWLNDILVTLSPGLKYLWDNLLVPLGEWTGETIIAAIEGLTLLFGELGTVVTENGDTINQIIMTLVDVFSLLGRMVGGVLKAAMTGIGTFSTYIDDIVVAIIDILDSFVNGFIGNVLKGDWEAAWEGLKETFGKIWDGIKLVAIAAVNSVIDTLNKISFTVPDWVPGLGGKYFGFNIPRIDDSGVSNNTSHSLSASTYHRATSGYSNYSATNPSLIDTGSNKLEQILENMESNSGGGDTTVTLQLDGREIYRTVVNQNTERRRAGLPAFE